MASRDLVGSRHIDDAIAAGQEALEEGRFELAATHFRSALRMGPRSGEEEAQIRCLLSEVLENRGLAQEQLDAVVKYEKFAEFARLPEQVQMRALIRLGWGYSFTNDHPRAIALFNQAIQIARRLEDHAGMGACYFGLGRAYRQFSEIRIARDHYTSALEHYRQTGDWRKLAESYINIGYIMAYEGDYRMALQSLNQSLTIIGDKEDQGLLGRAHMYLAMTYDNLGSSGKAIASWEKCIEYFTSTGNSVYLAINQNNLADKLVSLGDWQRAEQLIKSALDVLSKASNVTHYGGVIDTLANLYLLQGKLEEADRLLDKSLEVVKSTKGGEWVELSTQITVGRRNLMKGDPDQAVKSFERAVEICVRNGDHRFINEAQLGLAEALLEKGKLEEARVMVEAARTRLRETPTTLPWGLMMRMVAKIEAAYQHIAAAIQWLGQSSSCFEIRGNVHGGAVNKVVRAQLFEKQGRMDEAIVEAEAAFVLFDQLGATIDARKTRVYLDSLKRKQQSGITNPKPEVSAYRDVDLASTVDGFITLRLVQASISRDLLLHEIASIARAQAASRAALVAEIPRNEDNSAGPPDSLKVAASVGLTEQEQAAELDLLSKLPEQDYLKRFVYAFTDHQQFNFLLHVIDPDSDRFRAGAATLEPLLCLAEQGLETYLLKNKYRKTQVFNPSRLLAEVELPGFVCASRAMSRVLEQIHKIRSSDVTVLITGESGTGKELIARAVHAGSTRRFNVFIPFNCSAAPREMVESQLFGYKRGAFTGAIASNEGIIRASEGGTLFLDEIGDLPLDLQPKLLRFLQEGEVHPIGENQPVRVDVRVVAATNSDLERAVADGRFREDLFHRLNVIRIQVPPLRERREEIPALLNHYMLLYEQEASKREIQLSEETVDLMVVYDWPGNVRQLCNEVRRIVAYSESGTIATPEALSPEIVRASREIQPATPGSRKAAGIANLTPIDSTLSEAVEELERRMIRDALSRCSGNIARAAKELGLSRKGLYLKMDRLNFKV